MIEIKNISKTFKNNKVLDGIDLTINQGDVVAIIGHSINEYTTIKDLVTGAELIAGLITDEQ